MSPITPALVEYWQRLPALSVASRRRHVAETCRRVRAGELPRAALVPYALGDDDEDVVATAAATFTGANEGVAELRRSAIEDAVEWIRRGLALNRAAVFAALLSAGDADVNERLAPHRLALSAGEVATVCRRVASDRRKATREFLRNWLELLGGDARRASAAAISSTLAAAAEVR
jgi:hypothetical protein